MYHITSFKDNGKFIVPQYSNYFLRCSQGKQLQQRGEINLLLSNQSANRCFNIKSILVWLFQMCHVQILTAAASLMQYLPPDRKLYNISLIGCWDRVTKLKRVLWLSMTMLVTAFLQKIKQVCYFLTVFQYLVYMVLHFTRANS